MGAAVCGAHRSEDRRIGALLMADTANIVMPMEQEGTKSVVRAWLKKIGDAVKRDEPIVELETDKVAVEVPAPADGVLTSIALNAGDEAAPGATLKGTTVREASQAWVRTSATGTVRSRTDVATADLYTLCTVRFHWSRR